MPAAPGVLFTPRRATPPGPPESPAPQPPAPAACPHEGGIVDRWRSACAAKVESLSVRTCAHPGAPGRCVRTANAAHPPGVRVCREAGCPLTTPARDAAAFTRHLLYFIAPVAGNGVWQSNVRQLLQRIGLFTGRRTVAVATAAGEVRSPIGGKAPFTLDPPDAVRAALAGHGFDVVEVPNDAAAGESVAFAPLWESVSGYTGPGDVTFYAHAKGVTYADPTHPAHRWASLLYAANLDYWPVVEAHFRAGRLVTGALRRVAPPRVVNRRRNRTRPGRLHYSGTFFWFANAATFARTWRRCRMRWGGIELWPGRVFAFHESGCVFHDEPPDQTAYNPAWLDAVLAQFEAWKAGRAAAA